MQIYSDRLFMTIQNLVTQHHTIYPSLPPQGIFFETLAERAFHLSGAPDAHIAQTIANAPGRDIIVGNDRVSVKTETGRGTRPGRIAITKLCTTEREPWEANVLVRRTTDHLSRYNRMIMLRSIWSLESIQARGQPSSPFLVGITIIRQAYLVKTVIKFDDNIFGRMGPELATQVAIEHCKVSWVYTDDNVV